MNNQYIFTPKNANLHHCSNSFFNALKIQTTNSTDIYPLLNVDFKVIWYLCGKIIRSTSNDKLSVFFLAVQSDYLILLLLLRFIARILAKNIKVYYLMHEPRPEKGRIHATKSLIIFMHQLLFGYLSDAVLLPSDQAISQAKTFINKDKTYKVNLVFPSLPQPVLEKNLQQLQHSWEFRKNFSMLGTISSLDKNPQGFLRFANIFHGLYPGKAQFIWGGRELGIKVTYSEEVIRFPCYLSNCSKSFLLHLSHFIIIPYSVSTQSGVIAESLGYGKFLIINDIPAFQYLQQSDFVFMVDFSAESSVVSCIQRILEMSFSEYRDRCWSAVEYFQKNHSEAYLIKKMNAFL